jgi:hypothetical protein
MLDRLQPDWLLVNSLIVFIFTLVSSVWPRSPYFSDRLLADIMEEKQLTREEVWQSVKDGVYIAYRARYGGNWEWRLQARNEELPNL